MTSLPIDGEKNWGDKLRDYLEGVAEVIVDDAVEDVTVVRDAALTAVTDAAQSAVEAAVTELDLILAVETDSTGSSDRVAVKFDDSDTFAYIDETDGLVDTKIEGALPVRVEGYGAADLDVDSAGVSRLTSVLTSGPDLYGKGDSIQRAWFPDLAVALAAYGYPGRVVNYAVGGENTPTILARTGGSPFLATITGNSIPADGSAVTVTLTDTTGLSATDAGANVPRLNPLAQAPDGFNPCTLVSPRTGARVRGIMTCHDATGSNPFTFKPLAAPGVAVPFDFPAPVVTWAAENTMHGVQILAVGQNDNNDGVGDDFTYAERFDLIQQFIDRMPAGHKRYLIVLPFSGGPTTRLAEETEANRRWGRHALALRPWLASYAALAAAGVTPTASDDVAVAAGNVAASFYTSPDFVHPNAVGRQALIRAVLNRLIELGWI